MAKLLKRVGIPKTDDWDYLLVGDGSGTTLERTCGWASVLISRKDQRKAFWGSFSVGTNNIAEMMAYALPLLYLSQVIPKRRTAAVEKGKPFPDVIKIHVISDSEYVVLGGKNPLRRKANGPLWQLMQRAAAESGIRISWHHDRRDISDLNRLSHELANVSRKNISPEQLTDCLRKIRRKSLERTTAFEKKTSSKENSENSSKLETKTISKSRAKRSENSRKRER